MVIKDHAQELFLFQEMKEGKEYAFDFFSITIIRDYVFMHKK